MNKGRFSVLLSFFGFVWVVSLLVRTSLLGMSPGEAHLSFAGVWVAYLKGFLFDTAVATYFALPYGLYLWLLPRKWSGSRMDRVVTYTGFFLSVMILMFAFFAEFPFWEEFGCRFNFIAVDYLIYTYEVVNNINQSYPLPLLIGGMIAATLAVVLLVRRTGAFKRTFGQVASFGLRSAVLAALVLAATLFTLYLPNSFAEGSGNRYADELGKAGVYSFFAAYRGNALEYDAFYRTIPNEEAFAIERRELASPQATFTEAEGESIRRRVDGKDSVARVRPNIVLVTIESFSASFMRRFGNEKELTPFLDSLANHAILFTNLYANGTRTVRGMEALALSTPPTPGNSIVRRPGNGHLFSIGSVLAAQGYRSSFIYGGDGYFDNMNAFFGNNGFDIIDRGSRVTTDKLEGKRARIPDEAVTFENAWGICDEDLYAAALRDADEKARDAGRQPFFQFIMTTSNHRPYTYPEGKIDIPSGSGRPGAVKYTDYALRRFIEQMRERPWFSDPTVVIIVADHCANSAGRNAINVDRYRIPCLIYNMPGDTLRTIDKQCSQIDIFPTLFAMLGWTYDSEFYGQDVLADSYRQRAFVGTYQKLGYMERDSLVILSPQRLAETFLVEDNDTKLTPIAADSTLEKKAIAAYQSASWLFKSGGMRE
ncbi:MAG: sulfatase-like hydrolase/transferase [Mediterranea sp.]|jgi:phosphoglycerol transferase MdoB-like AlkP superfamily enzyme|nr:sulfatase-like hydrolase/transferase [Mediterranea sp.]